MKVQLKTEEDRRRWNELAAAALAGNLAAGLPPGRARARAEREADRLFEANRRRTKKSS